MWEVDAGEGVRAEVFVAASIFILCLIPGAITCGVLRWLLRPAAAASEHVLKELELGGRGEDKKEQRRQEAE